jgi:hypothetical protein
MAAFRFLAAVFALVAVIALVSDITQATASGQAFAATSIAEHWAGLSPKTLQSAEASVSNMVGQGTWSALRAVPLGLPTFAVFGALAVLCGYIGRHRRRINIYVN